MGANQIYLKTKKMENKKQKTNYYLIPEIATYRSKEVKVIDTDTFYEQLGFPLIPVQTFDWSKTLEEKEQIKKMKAICK
jgi:hypothetical protein